MNPLTTSRILSFFSLLINLRNRRIDFLDDCALKQIFKRPIKDHLRAQIIARFGPRIDLAQSFCALARRVRKRIDSLLHVFVANLDVFELCNLFRPTA